MAVVVAGLTDALSTGVGFSSVPTDQVREVVRDDWKIVIDGGEERICDVTLISSCEKRSDGSRVAEQIESSGGDVLLLQGTRAGMLWVKEERERRDRMCERSTAGDQVCRPEKNSVSGRET